MGKPIHEVYVVTVVEYIGGEAQDPINYVFDNEPSADKCFCFLSEQRGSQKVYMQKEEVYGSFMLGGAI